MFTQQHIEELIECPKKIAKISKRRASTNRLHKQSSHDIISLDGNNKFRMFTRQSIEFIENFSIGLIYINDSGKEYTLVRCNGKHGEHSNGNKNIEHHFDFHIHFATEQDVEDRPTKPRQASVTDKFYNFESAIEYFSKLCNIINMGELFPELFDTQTSFL